MQKREGRGREREEEKKNQYGLLLRKTASTLGTKVHTHKGNEPTTNIFSAREMGGPLFENECGGILSFYSTHRLSMYI